VGPDRAREILSDCGAVLKGHFILSSGLHSDTYVQCAKVFQHPALAREVCEALARRFEGESIDVVCGPALGGIVMAYEMARQLDAKAIFTERQAGMMMMRRGFEVDPGENVLVVEDVVTTGTSAREALDILRGERANVLAVAAFVDRGGGASLGVPFEGLVTMDPPAWDPERCVLCEAGTAAIHPGGAPQRDYG
jgi:orotate phosphoribosyltransferase